MLWHCSMLCSAQLFGSQYADCILWLLPFLFCFFFFLIRLERDYRLWSVHMIPANMSSITNCTHPSEFYLWHSMWQHEHTLMLPLYCINIHHKIFRTFSSNIRNKTKIPNSSFNIVGHKVFVSTAKFKAIYANFLFMNLRCTEIFFFFNVILIIAGFATERRSVWMHVWNFLFALSSVSFAIFSLAWVTYDYWLLHFVDGSALRTIAVRHNNIQATKTAASAIVALIRKRCNDVDEDMLKWKTDIFAKAIIFFNISI